MNGLNGHDMQEIKEMSLENMKEERSKMQKELAEVGFLGVVLCCLMLPLLIFSFLFSVKICETFF